MFNVAKIVTAGYNTRTKLTGITMIDIMGRKFITDKEAAERYNYSQTWFQHARLNKTGPKYIQIKDKGRVLYPLIETDEWFKARMEMKE